MSPGNPRNGFAATVAIVLLGLVAASLAVMMTTFSMEAKRTRIAQEDAQLRQMLLAAAVQAPQHLGQEPEGSTSNWEMTVPPAAGLQGAKVLASSKAEGSTVTVELEAQLGKRRLIQRLSFSNQGQAWRLVSAELGG